MNWSINFTWISFPIGSEYISIAMTAYRETAVLFYGQVRIRNFCRSYQCLLIVLRTFQLSKPCHSAVSMRRKRGALSDLVGFWDLVFLEDRWGGSLNCVHNSDFWSWFRHRNIPGSPPSWIGIRNGSLYSLTRQSLQECIMIPSWTSFESNPAVLSCPF